MLPGQPMRFLITGVAGFIGSHLADRLITAGHEVWGVDNYETGRRDNVNPKVAFFLGDIVSRTHFYEIANDCKPDVVVHCAASYSDPNLWHRDTSTNVAGTINAVLAAKHHGARLVYFQTALPPTSSYAISKIAGEHYIVLSGVPHLIFRLANIYGPRNLSGPIPTFYKRLTNGDGCTVVDTSREMVFIDDLVWGVMRAIGSKTAAGKFDMCSGNPSTIANLYDAVADALESDAVAQLVPAGADDVKSMELDPSRAFAHLDWIPSTPLNIGVQAAVDWYRANGVQATYTHLKMAS